MLTIFPVKGIPEIKKGDELGKMIVEKVEDQGEAFQQGDIAVISQKVVSKAEGRVLHLSKIKQSDFAKTIANETGKNHQQVELVLQESRRTITIKVCTYTTEKN